MDPATTTKGLPFEHYVRLPGEHATALKDMLVSPRLYKHRRDNGIEDADKFRVGRAGHTAILEPDRFALEYTVWRADADGGTRPRRGKVWDAFCAANADKTILTEAQYMTALSARDAAREHPVASKILGEPGRVELTVCWTHERTGLRCKARFDKLCSALVDVKLTRDVSQHSFSNTAGRFGYALQLAFYRAAAKAIGLKVPAKIIAVQSVEPFDVAVYRVDKEVLDHGESQFEQALDKVIECTGSGLWPGIAHDEEIALTLPAWASPEFDDETITFDGAALF